MVIYIFIVYVYSPKKTCGYGSYLIAKLTPGTLCFQGDELVAHRDAELSGFGLHHGLGTQCVELGFCLEDGAPLGDINHQ